MIVGIMNRKEKYRGFKPLTTVDGSLIFYSKGYLWKITKGNMTRITRLFEPSFKDKFRLAIRFFRREPKLAVAVSDDEILISFHKKIQLVNLKTEETKLIQSCREGFSDPLNICNESSEWLAVWGDYGDNKNLDFVNVYGLTSNHKVETLYKFGPGTIRHIHNIVPCLEGGYYLLTGDNEQKAGIYKASADFKIVRSVLVGNQQYRAVVGFDTQNGLLFATDSVNAPNHIYVLNNDGKIRLVGDLNGSCIYGVTVEGKYYFSTTVEPDETRKGLLSWISYKKGKGILSNYVQVVCVSDRFEVSEILRLKKDFWPMKLMQYGAVQFPRGQCKNLWIYPIAVERVDGCAERL